MGSLEPATLTAGPDFPGEERGETTDNLWDDLWRLIKKLTNQENKLAAEQFALAKQLDPNDPTPYLYDAIRKQSENRPVEALHDLQQSIKLNDNRAVYRSRELLDDDRAARGASLAQIYNNLGFQQLGINEATRSLTYDPSNAGAHRFLSDVYTTLPRREVARLSEQLQAQLLQDVNINPVQPSLSVTNFGIFAHGGPARAGFNEYTPLFERNQAQLNVTGVAGGHETYGDEAVLSGLYDRYSLSVGQFHLQSDGFRDNNDLNYNIYNAFGQVAVTPELNVQAELRRVMSDSGDLSLAFSPNEFSQNFRRRGRQDTGRVGVRFAPTPYSNIIGSIIYNDIDEKFSDTLDLDFFPLDVDFRSRQKTQGMYEGKYVLQYDLHSAEVGVGVYEVDNDLEFNLNGESLDLGEQAQVSTQQVVGYGYFNITFPSKFVWTLGWSYDDYEQKDLHLQKINPKIGVQWDLTPALRLRLATLRTVKPPLAANRTIQPTQVAGFNQFFDDVEGTEAWLYGAALDARVTDDFSAGVEAFRRDLKVPITFLGEGITTERESAREDFYGAYLYWTPHPEWALSTEFQVDRYETDGEFLSGFAQRVDTFNAPLSVRYFSPLGFFAILTGDFVYQNVNRKSDLSQGRDHNFLVDATVGYRLPQRRGIISLEVRNLFDSKIKFQDDSFRDRRELLTTSRFSPERTIVGYLTLSF